MNRAVLTVLALSLVLRIAVLAIHHDGLARDPDAYRELAQNLREQGTYGHARPPGLHLSYPAKSPVVSDGNAQEGAALRPTAHRPPLYPLLLIPATSVGGWMLVELAALHVVLGFATVWLVWRLAEAWSLPPGARLVAAGLVACDPILVNQSTEVMTEIAATFLAAAMLTGWTRASSEASTRAVLMAGVMAGLAILCRPTFLPAVVLAAPFLAGSGERRWRRAAIYLLAVAGVLSPWVVRNQLAFGRPIVTTTHGGHTLRLANNPQYYAHVRANAWGTRWDSRTLERVIVTDEEAAAEGLPREVLLDRRNYALALAEIRRDPSGFALATVDRLAKTWRLMPAEQPGEGTLRRMARWGIGGWYLVVFVLAIAGCVVLRKKLVAAPWLFGVLLVATFTLTHAAFWTDMRMRAPLVPVVSLLAAAGLAALRTRRLSPSGIR